MLKVLKAVENVMVTAEKIIMMSIGLLLPVIITVGVFFRYVLKSDLYAIEEIEVFIAIWFYFMGAAYASYKESHITADILQVMTKSFQLRKFFAMTSTLLTFLISLYFAYWCTDMITYAWDKAPRTAVWKLPLLIEYAAVYIGMILMSLYAFRDFIKACMRRPEY